MANIEYNEEYDKILRYWVKEYPRSYFKKIKAKSNQHILNYIEKCTPLLGDDYLISTKVYWVLNKLDDFPTCKICGNKIFKNIKVTEGYPSHCSAQCLSDDPEVFKHKQEAYQKKYGSGITNPFQAKEVISSINETNIKKYGVKRFTQTSKYKSDMIERRYVISQKKYETHVKNKSFSESKPEIIAFELLKKRYPDLIRHYKSKQYPFECDFYSSNHDLYIEYNGTWTHGGHFYDENNLDDKKVLKKWEELSKKSNNNYYTNAIYTWSILDVKKRKIANDNKLNYIVFWNLDEIYRHIIPNYDDIINVDELIVPFRRNTLLNEFKYYKNEDCSILNPYVSLKNEIIKFFQQDVFFKTEKNIWKTDIVKKHKLIENRVKFLKKDVSSLTHLDILNGFKRSGLFYGYSHFNPLWFKWFLNKFNVKICYDPTGGWGHRLLGALNIEKYIYNDLSMNTKLNVDRIIDFFKIKNVDTYCKDAKTFTPDDNFDAMFTCPPYFNVEKYECEEFDSIETFNKLIDSLFDVFYNKKSCKVFGIVIREDLLIGHDDYTEKIQLNKKIKESYLSNSKNKSDEWLFIFKK